jgi:hypothetical protein
MVNFDFWYFVIYSYIVLANFRNGFDSSRLCLFSWLTILLTSSSASDASQRQSCSLVIWIIRGQ